MKRIYRQDDKAHIELRKPLFGVEAVGEAGSRRVEIKIEAEPFSIGGHEFNGAFMELPLYSVHRLINQLQRGITLMERMDKLAEAPDDNRFK